MRCLLAVIGTRPQFIKYAALARYLENAFSVYVVDTGQHYDPELSAVFLNELTIRQPDCVLDGRHERVIPQIARMMEGVDEAIRTVKPAALVCMGDTNSTLAGALAGVKNDLRVAHIEAGERNFKADGLRIPPWSTPEEANRTMVDQASSLLLCASRRGEENLRAEGRGSDAVFTGDLMWDLHKRIADRMVSKSGILARLGLRPGQFIYCTVHRACNTDSRARLGSILEALELVEVPVAFPVHPRTRGRLQQFQLLPRLLAAPNIRVLDPVSYGESVALCNAAQCVVTDSGGVTREAFFSGVPSVILDDSTAWIDIVEAGWAELTGADTRAIIRAVGRPRPSSRPNLFGNGRAATRIVEALTDWVD